MKGLSNVGLLNIYSFDTFKKAYDTSFFPLRSIIVYGEKQEEEINKLSKWLRRKFVFVREEDLPKKSEPQKVWEIWKREFLKKKGIKDIELFVNLSGTDPSSKSEKANIITKVKERINFEYFRSFFGDCINEECSEDVFQNMVERITSKVLSIIFPKEESKDIGIELIKKIDSENDKGDTVKLYIQRHRKWIDHIGNDSHSKVNWTEKDVYITVTGAMLGFSILKNTDYEDDTELFKIVEKVLYRLLIMDERVIRYVLENDESNVINLHYAGINVGVIKVKTSDREITCFNDRNLEEKIEKLRIKKENDEIKVYIPFLEINVEDSNKLNIKLNTHLQEDSFYDIAIIHISCLEKLAKEVNIKPEEFIQTVVESLKERIPNIYLTTGRGRINLGYIKDTKFIPFSILNASLYGGLVDKILLIDSLALVRGGNIHGKR